ncbi:P-loop NTPase fold protein [Carnobacterium divergens]|uniref:P-loop NTPase fold protein n=3 Tax=Carnobacterium divergens TaxID=2748 RepID=UPI0039C90AD4
MRDEPIKENSDPDYSIKIDNEANEEYDNLFKNDDDDVIFLNGKWGSGKTSYLNILLQGNVKKEFKLFKFKCKCKFKKDKTIDLWRITSNKSTTEIFYRKNFPISGFFFKYIFLFIFLFLSGVATFLTNLDFKDVDTSSVFKNAAIYIFFVSGFLSGLNQIIGKINYDNLFLKLIKYRTSKVLLCFQKKRIIIIDDFDRIDSSRQLEMYKIFNLVTNKKIQFVFLGDYSQIEKSEGAYLQKIIDRKIELPYALSPSHFWPEYFKSTIEKIEKNRACNLVELEKDNLNLLLNEILRENRTLREKKLFEKYIKELLFQNERFDKVNIDQQFLTIYLYLFHSNFYTLLVSQIDSMLKDHSHFVFSVHFKSNPEQQQQILNNAIKKLSSPFKIIDNQVNIANIIPKILFCYDTIHTLSNNRQYKYSEFTTSYPNYLVNYVPINISGRYVRDILNQPIQREKLLIELNNDKNSDIVSYLKRNQSNFSSLEKENLLKVAFELVKKYDDIYSDPREKASKTVSDIQLIVLLALMINYNATLYQNEKIREELQNDYIQKLDDVSCQLQFYKNYLHFTPEMCTVDQYNMITSIVNTRPETINRQSFPENIYYFLLKKNKDLSPEQVDNLVLLQDKHFYLFLAMFNVEEKDNRLSTILDANKKRKIFERYSSLDFSYKEKLNIGYF